MSDDAVTFDDEEIEQLREDGEWDDGDEEGDEELSPAEEAEEGEEEGDEEAEEEPVAATLAKEKAAAKPAAVSDADREALLGALPGELAAEVGEGKVTLAEAVKRHYHSALSGVRGEMARRAAAYSAQLAEQRQILARILDHMKTMRPAEPQEEEEVDPVEQLNAKLDGLDKKIEGRTEEEAVRHEVQAVQEWAAADAAAVRERVPEYDEAEEWLAGQMLERAKAEIELREPHLASDEVERRAGQYMEQVVADLMVKHRSEGASLAASTLRYAAKLGWRPKTAAGTEAATNGKPRTARSSNLARQRERMEGARSNAGARSGGARTPRPAWGSAREMVEDEEFDEDALEKYLGDDDGTKFRELAKRALATN